MSNELLTELKNQMRTFFNSSSELKESVRRKPNNSRGYANDELTKQLVDAKEVFDAGRSELYLNLSDKAHENQLLDGQNYWPDAQQLPLFRSTVEDYFSACERLAMAIFHGMLSTLECGSADLVTQSLVQHTSFVRLNYYPVVTSATACSNYNKSSGGDSGGSSTCSGGDSGDGNSFGVSRHTDSGVLTVLLQDEQSALEVHTYLYTCMQKPFIHAYINTYIHIYICIQVYSGSKQDRGDGEWLPVVPLEGALTVNTGDMLQVTFIQK